MTADPIMISPDSPPPPPQNDRSGDAAELVAEERFSIVPEWVLDSDIGDCALRLYAMLLRYSNITGARMPARSTLATRLHKKSTDTVDRGLTELVALGAPRDTPLPCPRRAVGGSLFRGGRRVVRDPVHRALPAGTV